MKRFAIALPMLIIGGVFVATVVFGQAMYLKPYYISVVDQYGEKVTDTLDFDVYTAGSTVATVYADRAETAIGTTLDDVTDSDVVFYGENTSYDIIVYSAQGAVKEMGITPAGRHQIILPDYEYCVDFPAWDQVDITSPTTTFSAEGKHYILLSSDQSITGVYPTTGALNQEIVIKSYTTGSNTIRFDDGTSMTIGGNITLQESQNDVLCLKCIDADGDEWMALYAHDN